MIDSDTNLGIDLYIKSIINKDDFLIKYQQKLLPNWQYSINTIIFIFFECKYPLDGSNLELEQLEKDRLLLKFNKLGFNFYNQSNDHNILSEIICPKDGFPLFSQKGQKFFSIQKIVNKYLPSFAIEKNKCGLIHPLWGKAVYPCIIVSAGTIEQIKFLLQYMLM